MKWDIELNPRAELRIKFTEEETIEYGVKPLGGTGVESRGKVTVGEQSSHIYVVDIYDDNLPESGELRVGLEPADVKVKTNNSLTWKNNGSSKVRLYSLPKVPKVIA